MHVVSVGQRAGRIRRPARAFPLQPASETGPSACSEQTCTMSVRCAGTVAETTIDGRGVAGQRRLWSKSGESPTSEHRHQCWRVPAARAGRRLARRSNGAGLETTCWSDRRRSTRHGTFTRPCSMHVRNADPWPIWTKAFDPGHGACVGELGSSVLFRLIVHGRSRAGPERRSVRREGRTSEADCKDWTSAGRCLRQRHVS